MFFPVLTVENKIISFSLPWNPSMVSTSIKSFYFYSLFLIMFTCFFYGEMTPIKLLLDLLFNCSLLQNFSVNLTNKLLSISLKIDVSSILFCSIEKLISTKTTLFLKKLQIGYFILSLS